MLSVAASGCVVEHHVEPGDTQIGFEQSVNVGACGDPGAFLWTVTNRTTSEAATASCSQPVLFTRLTPNATYRFDIQGTYGGRVCWQGSCDVTAAYGVTTWADCAPFVTHLCGF